MKMMTNGSLYEMVLCNMDPYPILSEYFVVIVLLPTLPRSGVENRFQHVGFNTKLRVSMHLCTVYVGPDTMPK